MLQLRSHTVAQVCVEKKTPTGPAERNENNSTAYKLDGQQSSTLSKDCKISLHKNGSDVFGKERRTSFDMTRRKCAVNQLSNMLREVAGKNGDCSKHVKAKG